jgi:hypothetical protein
MTTSAALTPRPDGPESNPARDCLAGASGDATHRVRRDFVSFVIIAIVAALLTPGPDVSSVVLLSLPMILLYELGILLVGRSRSAAVE